MFALFHAHSSNGFDKRYYLALILFVVAAMSVRPSYALAENVSYAVHLSSCKSIENADREVSKLKNAGFDAFHRYESVKEKGKWYRIYAGKYASKSRAAREANTLKQLNLTSYCSIRTISKGTKVDAPPGVGVAEGYYLHVSSFGNKSNAEKEAKRLEKHGYKCFALPEDVWGKTWFRVYIGVFSHEGDARKKGAELKRNSIISYFKPTRITPGLSAEKAKPIAAVKDKEPEKRAYVTPKKKVSEAGGIDTGESRVRIRPREEQTAYTAHEKEQSAEIMEGFDDDDEIVESEIVETGLKPSRFNLDGHFKLASSINFPRDTPSAWEADWRGISRLRTELQLELDAKITPLWQVKVTGKGNYDFAYTIKDRDDFTEDVLDNYESELEFGEAYFLGSLADGFDIKVGRQIVVWGKSDNVRVTDVLNPLDLREPGITDIEDLRLPVGMTRFDFYVDSWNLTAIALHEIRFGKLPEYGSDFYPEPQPLPPGEIPTHGGNNTEFAAALNGIFRGWDLSFYWADIFNDLPNAELVSGTFPPQIRMNHTRLTMLGMAVNVALGNWLIKTEGAHFNGFRFLNTTGKRFSRIDATLGIEYSGFNDTGVSVEIIDRYLYDFDPVLEEPPDSMTENQFQSVVRLTRNFINETLKLTFLASTFGATGEDGALQRLSAEYDYTDAFKISGGIVLYQSGDRKEFKNIGDNDRLFIETKYSF